MRPEKKSRLIDDARDRGRKARLEGKPRECPIVSDYPVKGARAAWLEGWDEAGPPVAYQEVQIKTQEVAVKTPGMFWPKDKALPEAYVMRRPAPCRNCRCVTLPDGNRAVLCSTTTVQQGTPGIARLQCRNCNSVYLLPIRLV